MSSSDKSEQEHSSIALSNVTFSCSLFIFHRFISTLTGNRYMDMMQIKSSTDTRKAQRYTCQTDDFRGLIVESIKYLDMYVGFYVPET